MNQVLRTVLVTQARGMPRCYYEVLGVEKGSDKKAIEKA
jgi:hypothetical protein